MEDNGNGRDSLQGNLNTLDRQNLLSIEPELERLGIDLPQAVVEHAAVLGEESVVRSGDFISYEVAMIDVCEQYLPKLTDVFFANTDEINIEFRGKKYKITRDSLGTDLKYAIFPDDFGKAGWDEQSRKVVPRIFNNLQLRGSVHGKWLMENQTEAFATIENLIEKGGLSDKATPSQMEGFKKAIAEGRYLDLPLSLVIQVSQFVSKDNPEASKRAAKLKLSDEDIQILIDGMVDPRITTTGEVFNMHVPWGEQFLKSNIQDERTLAIMMIGLMHHYTKDNVPAAYKNGELKLGEDAMKIVGWLQLLDMADGIKKRSTPENRPLKERLLALVKMQARGEDSVQKVEFLTGIADLFDWDEIDELLGDKGRFVEPVEAKREEVVVELKEAGETRKKKTRLRRTPATGAA